MQALTRWLLIFVVACITALVAVAITVAARKLTDIKFNTVNHLISLERQGELRHGAAFAAYMGFALLFAGIASATILLIEPIAQGSGISEIKCVLNGVRIPRATRFKTLLAKVISIIFAVPSGLPVGKEGPMIHSGAVVAAGVSQGKSKVCGVRTPFLKIPAFRNDKEKRDFIASGAAAGVAAAFGAPIGGVMFVLEEGASFWSQSLTWRTFFCAVVATYVLDVFLSAPGVEAHGAWGKLNERGLFSFGDFSQDSADSWVAWELPVFMTMGALGGVWGALFNWANEKLTVCRMRRKSNVRRWRFSEVMFIAVLVTTISFLVPLGMGKCHPVPKDVDAAGAQHLIQFYCDTGTYNPVATYFFAPAESAIKQLFHTTNDDAFELGPLMVFFLLYQVLTCVTYGTAVASGLFIPCLLGGSALGRFVGQIINLVGGAGTVDAGTYALIGAAAVLGGMARMTISLAVILIEATGDLQYGVPLMLTLMAARFAGNLFNEGLYDVHIHLKRWPLLEEKIPKVLAPQLQSSDVMAAPVVVLRDVETVERILTVLKHTSHHSFPIVFTRDVMQAHPRLGNFAGIIHRKHLSVLLSRKAFHATPPKPLMAALTAPPPLDELRRRADPPSNSPGAHQGQPQSHQRFPLRQATSMGDVTSLNSAAAAGPGGRARPSAQRQEGGAGGLRTSPASSENSYAADEDATRGRPAKLPLVGLGTESSQAAETLTSPLPESERRGGGGVHPPGVPAFFALSQQDRLGITSAGRRSTSEEQHGGGVGEFRGGAGGGTGIAIQRSISVRGADAEAAPVSWAAADYSGDPLLSYSDFEAHYPRYPSVSSLKVEAHEMGSFVDLRPYMNPTPYTVHACAPVARAFALVRGLGLRHVAVVNDCHDVVGIITRANLTTSHLKGCLAAKQEGQQLDEGGEEEEADGDVDASQHASEHVVEYATDSD